MAEARAAGHGHPLERVWCILNAAVQYDLPGLRVQKLESSRPCHHGGGTGCDLHGAASAIVPVDSDIGALGGADGEQAAYSGWGNVVEGAVPVPLVEATCALIALCLRDVGW